MPLFDRVTIVGLGLIGGSLGMAVRTKRLAREVIGLSRTNATVQRARRRGAIDWGTTDLRRAVSGAQVVVLAAPVRAIASDAKRLAQWMPPQSILTDVGSTKSWLAKTIESSLPAHVQFVGAHPLAGSEQRGIGAAHERLFDGCLCMITRTSRTSPRALKLVTSLWRPLVRRVIVLTPEHHDDLMAQTSHLAHLLAFGLAASVSRQGLAIAPKSFQEMTRVAKSDPVLWSDIFITNRACVLAAMDRFYQRCATLRAAIQQQDYRALRSVLANAKGRREALDSQARVSRIV